MKIGEQVKLYRTLSMLSQSDLAEDTGIKQQRISAIERGEAEPTEEEVAMLCEAFGIEKKEMELIYSKYFVTEKLRDFHAMGKNNGIPASDLARALHMPERALRRRVEMERIAGALICNDYDQSGYYLATTQDEMQRFLKCKMSIVRTLSRQCKSFRAKIKECGGKPCA